MPWTLPTLCSMRTQIRLADRADQLAVARAALEEWAWPQLAARSGLADDLVIVADELCSNAVRHGGAPIVLTAALAFGHVRISVRDSAVGRVDLRPREPQHPLAAGGRGLMVVDRLARAWGWHADGRTTVVWAELAGACLPASGDGSLSQ